MTEAKTIEEALHFAVSPQQKDAVVITLDPACEHKLLGPKAAYIFEQLCHELIMNSAEQEHVTRVNIDFQLADNTATLTVQDDANYGENAPAILQNICSDNPQKIGKSDEFELGGGLGLHIAKAIASHLNGEVTYTCKDNAIVTQATWDQNALLNLDTESTP